MKATDTFKKVINDHLQIVAKGDPLFAETLKKPEKNIDDCVTYILNEVKKSGCNGFADEEVFGMAIHYYDEDNIKVGQPINGKVVVNQTIAAPKPKTKEIVIPTPVKKKIAKKPELSIEQASLF